jgi:hypothetical protein
MQPSRPARGERSNTMPDGQPQAPNDPSIVSGNALDVLEAGQPTNLIIERTRAFQVAMQFQLAGALASALVGALEYQIRYFFDELGGPNEGSLGTVAKLTKAGQLKYDAKTPAGAETVLDVPANKLTPGTYKLNAAVSFRIAGVNFPMFAFTDGPVIEIV